MVPYPVQIRRLLVPSPNYATKESWHTGNIEQLRTGHAACPVRTKERGWHVSFAQSTNNSDSKPNQRTFADCSKCGREFHSCSVQTCPHKDIIKDFGPKICLYCCQGCVRNIFEGNGQACKLMRAARSNMNLNPDKEIAHCPPE